MGPIVLDPPEGYICWTAYASDHADKLLRADINDDEDDWDLALSSLIQLGALVDRIGEEARDQQHRDRWANLSFADMEAMEAEEKAEEWRERTKHLSIGGGSDEDSG